METQTIQINAVPQKMSPVGNSGSSLFYSSLPSLIQDRVPRIPSLRKIVGSLGKNNTENDTRAHRRSPSMCSEISTAPPPSYHEEDPAFCPSPPRSRPSSSSSSVIMQGNEEETASGVRWEHVSQGYFMLSHSLQNPFTATTTPEVTRRLYMSAMEYFLAGLPEDLTPEELLKLRLRLPPALLPEAYDPASTVIVRSSTPSPSASQQANEPVTSPQPSMLHQSIATVTFYAFLAFAFLLPYIKLFLHKAYVYDRQHKISDRLVAQGLIVADRVSQQTMSLAGGVCAINEGKVGEAAKLLALWWVQGVSGGVCEGVGGGMAACGLRVNPVTRKIESDGIVDEE